eukprot:285431_1
MDTLLLILLMIVKNCISVDDLYLRYGFVTSNLWFCGSVVEHDITLYWDSRMYQCKETPLNPGQLYLCDPGEFVECEALNIPLNYGMQIGHDNTGISANEVSCIQTLYVETRNRTTDNRVSLIEVNVNQENIGNTHPDFGSQHRLFSIDPTGVVKTSFGEEVEAGTADCSQLSNNEFIIGFRIGTDGHCGSNGLHTITLYWYLKMYQCIHRPHTTGLIYGCNVKDNEYIECNPSNRPVNYGMHISGDSSDISCIDALYVKEIDSTTGDTIDEMLISVSMTSTGPISHSIDSRGRIYEINPVTHSLLSVSYGNGVPDCDPFVQIEVTSCDGWDYGSISNSLQIQLKGNLGASKYFFVNKLSQLPMNGNISTFDISQQDIPRSADVGDLYFVEIELDDSYGYCIKHLVVKIAEEVYIFNENNYFGNGVIVAAECKYSYRYLGIDKPLISCTEDPFELSIFSKRGIYELDIHTCINDDSGMIVSNMKRNVYVTIMGKQIGQKGGKSAYSTTSFSYLDHYVAGGGTGNQLVQNLGHLIAGNFILSDSSTNILYSNIEGMLYGFKLETVNYEKNDLGHDNFNSFISTWTVSIDGVDVGWNIGSINNRYWIAYLQSNSRTTITTSSQIRISTGDPNLIGVEVNLYLILEGYYDLYQLPFTVEHSSADGGGINWFKANEECDRLYGTSLASVHSAAETRMLQGYLAGTHAWIGLFDLTLEKQNNWKWTDGSVIDYIDWSIGQPDNFGDGEDCGEIWQPDNWSTVGSFNDRSCSTLNTKFICASPHWTINTNRKFEMNVKQYLDDITLISVGNNHQQDNLCIDSISINDDPSIYISSNWIGGNSGYTALNAVFRYPVCDTQVIGVTIDPDSSTQNLISSDSMISSLKCENNNKLISSTCSISQVYEFSKTTSFSISNEDSSTDEYSWGTSSSVTLATSSTQATTTSNEFSFGFNEEVEIDSFAYDITLSANQQWTESTENTKENSISQENTNESNKQNTQSLTDTNSFESSFEHTETVSVECSAEMEIPPSHGVEYSLIFNSINTTINTYTDLKLTLCSAFLNPKTKTDESHYIYIDNIPGVVHHKETTSCTVQFQSANFIRNDNDCSNEQKLAIASGSNYIPTCKSTDNTLYDGCQCDVGDSRTLGICWCSDQHGNALDGKTYQIETLDGSYQEACVDKLKCLNTEVTKSVVITPPAFNYPILMLVANLLFVIAILLVCIYCVYYKSKVNPILFTEKNTHSYVNVSESDEQ